MANKKKSAKNPAPTAAPLPKWGLAVAALSAFLLVNTALILMSKLNVTNNLIRYGVVMVLAVFAGILARPLTMALDRRFRGSGK